MLHLLKINIMKQNKFTLLQYSIFATGILVYNATVEAQVIYTDLDPDLLLDEHDEVGGVDMNNDGVFDFAFLNGYATWVDVTSSGGTGASYLRYCQWAGGYGTPANQIAGTSEYFSEEGGAGFTRYYPYKLINDALIDSKLQFQSWGYQRMAFKSYVDNPPHIFDSGGFWFPNESEKFLGVRFVDSEDKLHYGWIRCSVIDSAEGLIIHDYAYEVEPDKPIEAGSTISYVGINDLTAVSNNFHIYTFNNNVFINSKEVSSDLHYQIVNLQGAIITIGNVNTNQIAIPIDAAAGIYLVELLHVGVIVYSKKVTIN